MDSNENQYGMPGSDIFNNAEADNSENSNERTNNSDVILSSDNNDSPVNDNRDEVSEISSEHTTENSSNDSTTIESEEPESTYRFVYTSGEKRDYIYNGSTYTYEIPNENTQQKKKKKRISFKNVCRFTALAACFGLIAGLVFKGVNVATDKIFYSTMHENVEELSDRLYDAALNTSNVGAANLSIASTEVSTENTSYGANVVDVVSNNLSATVAVTSKYKVKYYYGFSSSQYYLQDEVSKGSGFIVGITDKELLMATNNHVIENGETITVTLIDDSVYEAIVKGTDPVADLAIIAVRISDMDPKSLSAVTVAKLGDSNKVKLGEMCIAIGNALGIGQSVTVGYVSALDRVIDEDSNTGYIQTDAAINGGNSGGPLFNAKGEVIGINVAKFTDTSIEGMCFAIPISKSLPILNELMLREVLRDDEKGVLGISVQTVSSAENKNYGWPLGIRVAEVTKGGAADLAGIYPQDIITSVNGISTLNQEQLGTAIASYRAGTEIEIKLMRMQNGEYVEMTIKATLGSKAELEKLQESEAAKKATESEKPAGVPVEP